jgi:hypothetical protein
MSAYHALELAIFIVTVIILAMSWGLFRVLAPRRGGLFHLYFKTEGPKFHHGYPSLHHGGYEK